MQTQTETFPTGANYAAMLESMTPAGLADAFTAAAAHLSKYELFEVVIFAIGKAEVSEAENHDGNKLDALIEDMEVAERVSFSEFLNKCVAAVICALPKAQLIEVVLFATSLDEKRDTNQL